jgi:WhiB family redox-sensing transcriptional regulator
MSWPLTDPVPAPPYEALVASEQWRARAACRSEETRRFFPGRGNRVPVVVRHICSACPVSEPCLQWAMTHKELGIWAGTSEDDRRRMARWWHRQHGSESTYAKGCRCDACRKAKADGRAQ